jgi:hypothetical protein
MRMASEDEKTKDRWGTPTFGLHPFSHLHSLPHAAACSPTVFGGNKFPRPWPQAPARASWISLAWTRGDKHVPGQPAALLACEWSGKSNGIVTAVKTARSSSLRGQTGSWHDLDPLAVIALGLDAAHGSSRGSARRSPLGLVITSLVEEASAVWATLWLHSLALLDDQH